MLLPLILGLAASPTLSTPLPLPLLSTLTSLLISRQIDPPPGITCPGTLQKNFNARFRTIDSPNATEPNIFHVANSSATTLSQVLTISNIPSTASDISLMWAQSAPPRNFTATGGGTVNAYYLAPDRIPATGTLTEQNVDAAIDTAVGTQGRLGSAAFGGWPDVERAQSHLVGGVELQGAVPGTMHFRLRLQEAGEVRMEQGGGNGWFLMFNC